MKRVCPFEAVAMKSENDEMGCDWIILMQRKVLPRVVKSAPELALLRALRDATRSSRSGSDKRANLARVQQPNRPLGLRVSAAYDYQFSQSSLLAQTSTTSNFYVSTLDENYIV